MEPMIKVKRKVPARRTLLRFSFSFLIIWLCCQRLTKIEILNFNRHNLDLSDNIDTSYSASLFDPLKANLGSIFFRNLIHNNDSYEQVNEENLCSLMHFFIQEATINSRAVEFSTGTFILYDSTRQFFSRLMMAKNDQIHSDEHRAGYIRRLKYFAIDAILKIWGKISGNKYLVPLPLIYLRGDESSHFHERGNKYQRWHNYPAYGADIRHGCLPNHFGHVLFGKLNSLPDEVDSLYQGDRIYLKPEEYGLQQFPHYIAHAGHYIRSKLNFIFCQWIDRWNTKLCGRYGAFHEWTDHIWIRKWERILSTFNRAERRELHHLALSHGIHEIYRQTLRFPLRSDIERFRIELQNQYGSDVRVRRGNEIILTTEELLNIQATSDSFIDCIDTPL